MTDAILAARPVHCGWLDLVMLTIRLNGQEEERPLILHPSGAAVLPYDPDRRVALTIRETRAGPLHERQAMLIEAIAGVIDGDDPPEDTARREAMEEGGLALSTIERVACVWPNPGSSTERVHLYLAEYRAADRVAAGGGLAEENEAVRVREWPLAALWAALHDAEAADAKTLLLVQALRVRRPDLFDGGGPGGR